jgi:hypothetical protein
MRVKPVLFKPMWGSNPCLLSTHSWSVPGTSREVSKREEASTWLLGTRFMTLLQERHMEVESKKVY